MGGKIINLGNYNKPKRLKKFAGSASGICYTGLSASFQTEESDVIVIAANMDDLKKQYEKLTGQQFGDTSEQVAVFRFQDMRGRQCK